MFKPSQLRLPNLVQHGDLSYLVANIFIPNLISHSMPAPLSQHPHLRNFHLLNRGGPMCSCVGARAPVNFEKYYVYIYIP